MAFVDKSAFNCVLTDICKALCPESSTCAALQTIRHGIEAMHIDARADMKGVLWPFADERIGRLTNYVGATRGYFNMRTSPVDGANNPKLKFMHTDVLRGLLLRDIDGKVTEYKATPLEDLLLHIRLHHPSLAVVVQVEFRNELVTLVNILRARGLTSRVAVKFFTEAIGNLIIVILYKILIIIKDPRTRRMYSRESAQYQS